MMHRVLQSIHSHPTARYEGAHYRRYQWDMFQLPIGLAGFLVLTPGLGWVMTEAKIPSQGIEETSIRPSLMFDVGVHGRLAGPLALRLDARYEYVISDRMRSYTSGENLNLTGTFLSVLAGIELLF